MRKILLSSALILSLATSAFAAKMVGKWAVALDGSKTAAFLVASKSKEIFNEGTLGIRCNGKKTDVILRTPGVYLYNPGPWKHEDKGPITIRYSVDGGSLENIRATPPGSGGGEAVFLANGASFIKKLIDSKQIVVQFTHLAKNKELIFEIEGLREAISPYISMCPGVVLP